MAFFVALHIVLIILIVPIIDDNKESIIIEP